MKGSSGLERPTFLRDSPDSKESEIPECFKHQMAALGLERPAQSGPYKFSAPRRKAREDTLRLRFGQKARPQTLGGGVYSVASSLTGNTIALNGEAYSPNGTGVIGQGGQSGVLGSTSGPGGNGVMGTFQQTTSTGGGGLSGLRPQPAVFLTVLGDTHWEPQGPP